MPVSTNAWMTVLRAIRQPRGMQGRRWDVIRIASALRMRRAAAVIPARDMTPHPIRDRPPRISSPVCTTSNVAKMGACNGACLGMGSVSVTPNAWQKAIVVMMPAVPAGFVTDSAIGPFLIGTFSGLFKGLQEIIMRRENEER